MTKHIAQTLKSMATSSSMQMICDRTKEVDYLAEELLDHWSYDLYTRSPRPALLENGMFKPTDLDLACFLMELVKRKAVIVIPKYTSRRPKTVTEGERIVSKDNRHGHVLGLSANKEVFSFSIRIQDANVIKQTQCLGDQVGAPRNFMLVDLDGTWYPGWKCIEFMPSAKENDFLHDKRLWTGNEVVFKNFIHPNRWVSFFGQYYFVTKALIQRLEEENTFLRVKIKEALDNGVSFPSTGHGASPEHPQSERASGEPIKVTAFEAEVDVPMIGSYNSSAITDPAALAKAEALVKSRQYGLLPQLRFAVRATELAYSNHITGTHFEFAFPGWIKGAEWERSYKQAGKRKEWNRLVMAQLFPGQQGIALRWREYLKTERVAE